MWFLKQQHFMLALRTLDLLTKKFRLLPRASQSGCGPAYLD
jgi:hypothetical protein